MAEDINSVVTAITVAKLEEAAAACSDKTAQETVEEDKDK